MNAFKRKTFGVIMAGGSGTRFWPKSTPDRPKQFLSLNPKRPGVSLIQETAERLRGVGVDDLVVLTTRRLQGLVREHLGEEADVLAEPQARNTAACLYWAAVTLVENHGDPVMVVVPSDQSVQQVERWTAAVRTARAWVEERSDLVTMGVVPTRPETGFGYLRIAERTSSDVCPVQAFVEKPSIERAEEYLRSGSYLWNAGMFVFRARVLLEAFAALAPEYPAAWKAAGGDVDRFFSECPRLSIDVAVFEKAKNVMTVPLDCGWDDLGNWMAIEGLARRNVKDAEQADVGVVLAGTALGVDARRNIIDVPGKTVALVGVHDLIVVESDGVLLIASKEASQKVREVSERASRPRTL